MYAPRTGAMCDPSGWVGNCPFGEFIFGTECHSVVKCITTPKGVPMEHMDTDDDDLIAESLVEEVSIDGMCGVY